MPKFTLTHALALCLFAAGAFAQQSNTQSATALREVRGQTIISKELPAAEITFAPEYRYVGGQRVDLYGNADAEQHLFVKAAQSGVVERFYWVQFEHFYPTKNMSYDYGAERMVDFGGVHFVYDVKSWPDYAAMQLDDPASDGAAISRLLASHGLALPKRAARVRMFHLPTPDRRAELMIIYGEALPDGSSIPVGKEGINLDKESPADAKTILEHAQSGLKISAMVGK